MIKKIVISLSFMFFLTAAFAGNNGIVSSARKLMKNGDYYKAVIEYTKVLKENKDPQLFIERGDAKYFLENYRGAIGDYSSSLEIRASSKAYISRGKAELLDKQYDRAFEDFNAALAIEESPYVYALLSDTNFKKENYEESIKNYTSAIKLMPIAYFYVNRGMVYQNIKEYDKALQDYTKAIELDDTNAEYYTLRYELCNIMQKFDLADEDKAEVDMLNEQYESAIKRFFAVLNKKEDFKIHYKIGLLKSKIGDYAGAINSFTSSINIKKTQEAFFERGKVKAKIRKYNGAMEDFSSALKIKKTADTYFEMAEVYYSTEKYEQALEFYNKAFKAEPNLEFAVKKWECLYLLEQYKEIILEKVSMISQFKDTRLLDLAAKAEYKVGMYEEALKDLDKSLKISPKVETYMLAAEIYQKIKDYKKAILNYTVAIDIEKENVGFIAKQNLKDLYSKRADLYNLVGRKDLAQADKGFFSAIVGSYQNTVAISEFTKSLEMRQNADVYIARGDLKLQNQDYQEAMKDFNKALELKPSSLAYLYIGRTQMETDKDNKALESFNSSISLDENNVDTYYYLAKLMEKEGNYDKAIMYCSKALSLKKKRIYYLLRASLYEKILKNDLAMADKGNVKVIFDNYKEAINDYTKSLEIYENSFVYAKRGFAEEQLGMYEQALSDYIEAIDLDKKGTYSQLKENLVKKLSKEQRMVFELKQFEKLLFEE